MFRSSVGVAWDDCGLLKFGFIGSGDWHGDVVGETAVAGCMEALGWTILGLRFHCSIMFLRSTRNRVASAGDVGGMRGDVEVSPEPIDDRDGRARSPFASLQVAALLGCWVLGVRSLFVWVRVTLFKIIDHSQRRCIDAGGAAQMMAPAGVACLPTWWTDARNVTRHMFEIDVPDCMCWRVCRVSLDR